METRNGGIKSIIRSTMIAAFCVGPSSPASAYAYKMKAQDGAGNPSGFSGEVPVTVGSRSQKCQ